MHYSRSKRNKNCQCCVYSFMLLYKGIQECIKCSMWNIFERQVIYMSHMSLDNRVTIQEGLDQRLTLRTIAKMVDKAPSTILREINKHRCNKGKRYPDAIPPCARRDTCQITGLCHDTRCYAPCRNCNACRSK